MDIIVQCTYIGYLQLSNDKLFSVADIKYTILPVGEAIVHFSVLVSKWHFHIFMYLFLAICDNVLLFHCCFNL